MGGCLPSSLGIQLLTCRTSYASNKVCQAYKYKHIGIFLNVQLHNRAKSQKKNRSYVPIPPMWWHHEKFSPLAFLCNQAVKKEMIKIEPRDHILRNSLKVRLKSNNHVHAKINCICLLGFQILHCFYSM